MVRLPGRLFEIEQLRSPIALAKRMHVVDVAEDVRRFGCESCAVEASQEGALHQPAMNIRHPDLDEATELELVRALRYLDGPYLTGPNKRS